jgi:hypothetical protein
MLKLFMFYEETKFWMISKYCIKCWICLVLRECDLATAWFQRDTVVKYILVKHRTLSMSYRAYIPVVSVSTAYQYISSITVSAAYQYQQHNNISSISVTAAYQYQQHISISSNFSPSSCITYIALFYEWYFYSMSSFTRRIDMHVV